MTLLKFYEPVQTSFHHENDSDAFENLSRYFMPEMHPYGNSKRLPSTNIAEDDQGYRIEMALPGVDKKDIRIDHDNGSLTISVESPEQKEEAQQAYTVREFDYAGTSRTFRIGRRVDGEKIKASYKQGLLVLTLPKREEFIPKPAKSIAIE